MSRAAIGKAPDCPRRDKKACGNARRKQNRAPRIKFEAQKLPPAAMRYVMSREAAFNIFALAVGALLPIALVIAVLML